MSIAHVRFSNGNFSLINDVDHFSFSDTDVRLFQNADVMKEGKTETVKRLVIAYPLHKVRVVSFAYDKTKGANDNFTVVIDTPIGQSRHEGIEYDTDHRFTYDEHDNVIITRLTDDNRYQFQAVYNHMYVKNVVGTQWCQKTLNHIDKGEVETLPIMDKPESKLKKPTTGFSDFAT